METNKEERRKWTTTETRAFLAAYACRKEEFFHIKKRTHAMANVLADLEATGVLTQPTTAPMLTTKLKNLMRAFKTAKDAQNRTGAAGTKIPFEEEMEEIFGDRPILSKTATINIGGTPSVRGEPASALPNAREQEGPSSSAKKGLTMARYLEGKLELKRQALQAKMQMHKEKMMKLDELINKK